MNTNVIVAGFAIAITAIIWVGTTTNDESWTGNRNVCVGECYQEWKAENGGSIADIERVKQEALAAASPEAWARPTTVNALLVTVAMVRRNWSQTCGTGYERYFRQAYRLPRG